MNSAENALILALESAPEEWSIRLLVAGKMLARDAGDEAASIIADSPCPPGSDEELQKVVEIAGCRALPLARAYVTFHPTSGYGHQVLAYLLEEACEHELAAKHRSAATALGAGEVVQIPSPEGQSAEDDTQPPPPPFSTVQNAEESKVDLLESPALLFDAAPRHPPRRVASKATAVLVTVVVHLVIGLLAALMVILPAMQDDPEIVASIIAPPKQEQEIEKKNVVKQVKETASAASSAAAPVAQLMRANAMASFSMPEVTKTSTGPLGMGEGNLGSGSFGGTTGIGSGPGAETMFGSTGAGGIQGKLYDFKQKPDGKPTGIDPSIGQAPIVNAYYKVYNQYANSNFRTELQKDYFVADRQLSFTNLLVPQQSAEVGPKAFQVEKQVKPSAWMIHYSGRIVAPEPGEWRFAGRFDDVVSVFIDGKLVFNGSWHASSNSTTSQNFGKTSLSGQPPLVGSWVRFSGAHKVDILVGEIPGGKIGGALLIEKKGAIYKKAKDGTSIIPLFTTVPISDAVQKRIKESSYPISPESLVFNVVGG